MILNDGIDVEGAGPEDVTKFKCSQGDGWLNTKVQCCAISAAVNLGSHQHSSRAGHFIDEGLR